MLHKNTYISIGVILMLTLVIGGVFWFKNMSREEKPDEIPSEISGQFIKNILDKLPANYLVSQIQYLETPDAEERKAVEVRPCVESNRLEPTQAPVCFTILTLFEEKDSTQNIEEYIAGNEILSWYVGPREGTLIKATYQNIPLAYTPESFSCFGTGDATCQRRRYIYHLEDGKNVVVEVSFWPYKDGVPFPEAIKEVHDILKIYEELLI